MNNKTPAYSFPTIRSLYERTRIHRGVIDEVDGSELRDAYLHCRNITRDFARTFYLATRFLPYHKQRSIFAIYALCRFLDNLVDEMEDLSAQNKVSPHEIDEKLSEWKKKLRDTYNGKRSDHPILLAFSDVLQRHDISIDLPFKLIDGVQMDLVKFRYETFDELYDYSYKVASVVGLMVCEVFGYKEKAALSHAVDLGIAMQLTNILRDVGEDLQRDRIYLPAEDLKRFGISESDFKEQNITEEFIALMKFQIARARSYYRNSDPGIILLDTDSRIPVYLARYNYSRILDRIELNGYQVFTNRAHLSMAQKMAILPKVLWKTTFA